VETGNYLRLIDAELIASGTSTVSTGLLTGDSLVTVERSTITGTLIGETGYAVYVLGAGAQNVEIIDSVLWGTTNAVYNNSGGYVELNNTMTASGSLYKGPSASYRCRLVHNNLYATVTCP